EQRAVKWQAHLAAMRMPRQDQVEPGLRQLFNPRRVMHQENISCNRVYSERFLFEVEESGASYCKLPVGGDHLLIQQPCSATGGEAFRNSIKRNFAPVIVIARDTIYRRFDPAEQLQGFRQIFSFFNYITRETNKVRR